MTTPHVSPWLNWVILRLALHFAKETSPNGLNHVGAKIKSILFLRGTTINWRLAKNEMSKIDAYVFASVFPSKTLPSKKGQGTYPAQVRVLSRHGVPPFAASPLVFSVALSVTSVTVARRATRLGRLGELNSPWVCCTGQLMEVVNMQNTSKHSTTGGPGHHSLTLWSSNILQWYGLILVFVGH